VTFQPPLLLLIIISLDLIQISLPGDLLALASLGRSSGAALGRSLLGRVVLLVLVVVVFLLVVLELRALGFVIVLDTLVVCDFFRLRGLALLGFGLCEGGVVSGGSNGGGVR